MLARPSDPSFDRINMRSVANGAVVKLDWEKNATEQLAWPTGLPLEPGSVQVISDHTGAKHWLEFRSWPISGSGDAARAAGLALAGCRLQATVALDQLSEAVAPLDLYLDSSRGRYPTYHAGEPVELVLQTNRDAYLYCMIRDRDGHLNPLFPLQSAQAEFVATIPSICSGRSLPTVMRARAELDGSEIRCFASERDLATELPLAGAGSGAALPDEIVTALDQAIADSAMVG